MPKLHTVKKTIKTSDGETIPVLAPAYLSQSATWEKMKDGTVYETTIKTDISTSHFDQLHAVSQFAFDNSPERYQSIVNYDQWRKYVSIEVGWCDIIDIDGQIYKIPYSWQKSSFESNSEFMDRLYNPAMEWYSHLLGMFRDDLIMKSQGYTSQVEYIGGKK